MTSIVYQRRAVLRLIVATFLAATVSGCTCGPRLPPGSDSGSTPESSAGCTSGDACGPFGVCCAVGLECVEDIACAPPCATGIRCGADLSQCCALTEVCFALSCATPGTPCAGPDDCAVDEVCDPVLGACLPRPAEECIFVPAAGDFDPDPEWNWTGLAADSAVHNVLNTPMVADVDADGLPEVVFNAYSDAVAATLVVLNGDGTELASLAGVTRRSSHVALANLDLDAELEIVAFHQPRGVSRYDLTGGSLIETWVQDAMALDAFFNAGGVSIADLDSDGTPEIVVGRVVLDPDGNIIASRGDGGTHPSGASFNGWLSVVSDVNEDGNLNVVIGNAAYALDPGDPTGLAVVWENPAVTDGYTAVADMLGGGVPNVVTITEGVVYTLDGVTGSVVAGPITIPGAGSGGPPTIADFDGDGDPEIGIANLNAYSVLDLECVPPTPAGCSGTMFVRWTVPTEDPSTGITGSSVFDFEGDGSAEVLYNDECFLRVYRGGDGAVLLERPNTTRTATENPVVVDVDGDGEAELVVAANDDNVNAACPSSTVGVTAFGDVSGNWVRTRPVWNQHSYHVTNIRSDGTVPVTESRNWENPELNNFRMNTLGIGAVDAPDLIAVSLGAGLAMCPATLVLVAQVANGGVISAPAGIPVSFYRGIPGDATPDMLIGTEATLVPILPGGVVTIALAYDLPAADQTVPIDYYVVVDDDGTGAGVVNECGDDSNNIATLPAQVCIGLL